MLLAVNIIEKPCCKKVLSKSSLKVRSGNAMIKLQEKKICPDWLLNPLGNQPGPPLVKPQPCGKVSDRPKDRKGMPPQPSRTGLV